MPPWKKKKSGGETTSGDETDAKTPKTRKRDKIKRLFSGKKRSPSTPAETTTEADTSGDEGPSQPRRRSRKTKPQSDTDSDKDRKPKSSATTSPSGEESSDGNAKKNKGKDKDEGKDKETKKGKAKDSDPDPDGDPEGGTGDETGATTDAEPDEEGDDEKGTKKKGKGKRGASGPEPDDSAETEFQIRVLVIEGKELEGGKKIDPFVRVRIGDDRVQSTRTLRSTDTPYWSQNLYFTMRMKKKDLPHMKLESRVYTARRNDAQTESYIGGYETTLGAIYHQAGHSLVRRWAALIRKAGVDEEVWDSGVTGFLRFSVSVLAPGQRSPELEVRKPFLHALFPDSDSEAEVDENRVLFAGAAAFRDVALIVRIHYLSDLPLISAWKRKNVLSATREKLSRSQSGDYQIAVLASIAGKTASTQRVDASSPRINQEIRIPFKWPTVSRYLTLDLLGYAKKKQKHPDKFIGTCRITLSHISYAGAAGFMPRFGPAFVTFYGCRGKGKKADQVVSTLFKGRALIEVLTSEKMSMSSMEIHHMSSSLLSANSPFARTEKFLLFCSFFAGNLIGSAYKTEKVCFEISLGVYGNAAYPAAYPCSSRTTGVLPQYDGQHYYCMPWGNHKPCAVIPAFFESVQYRHEATNILRSMSKTVRGTAEEVALRIGGKEDVELASDVVALVDQLSRHIAFEFRNSFPSPDHNSAMTSDLDLRLYERRVTEVNEVGFELLRLRDLPVSINEASDVLLNLAERLHSLSIDPQGNIPDIVIWMIVADKRVAFASIPAHTVLYSENKADGCGENCGVVQPCPFTPVKSDNLHSFSELPALLQVRLWLGLEKYQQQWKKYIDPGEMRFFAESFENQHKNVAKKLTGIGEWKDLKKRYTNEDLSVKLPMEAFTPPRGWEWKTEWERKLRTFDTWVDRDAGLTRVEEEVYELQAKNVEKDYWAKVGYTDYDGFVTTGKDEFLCPENWEWSGGWTVDKNCPGDDLGWVYTACPNWEDAGLAFQTDFECAERINHLHRRKRWVRRRVYVGEGKETAQGSHNAHISIGDPDGWEYTTKLTKPTHLTCRFEDRYRRRRYHRELVQTHANDDLPSKISFRINRVHKQKDGKAESSSTSDAEAAKEQFVDVAFTSFIVFPKVQKWQLRAYIFQARDLFHASSRDNTFARVAFVNRCQETRMVKGTVNPMWQQTLIYEAVLITGSPGQIQNYPPIVAIEVLADREGLPPEFLGRCFAKVEAVCTVVNLCANDFTQAHLKWHPLEYAPGKFHGDLLAAFELYEADHIQYIPQYPAVKNADEIKAHDNKKFRRPPRAVYEIPKEIRPSYVEWNIEFLCYGVRNLKKYQLSTVRHPFVEFIVSDRIQITKPIADAKKNPNFDKPMIREENVPLPREVALSTPIQIVLKDERSFGRKPQVGICMIKDFRTYEADPPDMSEMEKDWEDKLNKLLTAEPSELREMRILDTERKRYKEERGRDPEWLAQAIAEGSDLDTASEAVTFDWWSKFYASANEKLKSQNYATSGLELVPILPGALEEVGLYAGFDDFVQTFPLHRIQRIKSSDPENCEFQGEIKGRLRMYKSKPSKSGKAEIPRALPGWQFEGPTVCCVRVYVVRATGLLSRKKDGSMSSYVQVQVGKKKVNSRKRSRQEPECPEFGEMFEFKALSIPQEKDITITVKDRRLIARDMEFGSTKIDLENRLLTKWRATVGLPAQFHTGGVNAWRDQWSPLRILLYYARLHQLPPVTLSKDPKDGYIIRLGYPPDSPNAGMEFVFRETELNSVYPPNWKIWSDGHLGSVKQQLALFVLRRLALVPEHVESRQLVNTINPSRRAGVVLCWVDIFPLSFGPVPPPVDIGLRKPIPMQLRIIIWQVREVVCTKTSFGKVIGDLCVRAFVNGIDKHLKTDVHYRSLDGSGSFNWRMMFDFDYSPWDKEVVTKKREHFWRRKKEEKHKPELVVQVLDNNKFKKDAIIGELRLNLLDFAAPNVDAESLVNRKKRKRFLCGGKSEEQQHQAVPLANYHSERKSGGADPDSSDVEVVSGRGAASARGTSKTSKKPVKKASSTGCCGGRKKRSGPAERVSLLDLKQTRGWWLVTTGGEDGEMVTGKLEMQMNLVDQAVAEEDPVGKGRKEPNHSPHLPKPDRPIADSHWLFSRFSLCKSMVWKKFKWYIIAAVCVFIIAIIIFIVITQLPSWIKMK